MPITPALKRLRQEGNKFKASPDLSKFQVNLSINELVSLKKKKKRAQIKITETKVKIHLTKISRSYMQFPIYWLIKERNTWHCISSVLIFNPAVELSVSPFTMPGSMASKSRVLIV